MGLGYETEMQILWGWEPRDPMLLLPPPFNGPSQDFMQSGDKENKGRYTHTQNPAPNVWLEFCFPGWRAPETDL